MSKDLRTAIEIYERIAEEIDKEDYGNAHLDIMNALFFVDRINPGSEQYGYTIGARVVGFIAYMRGLSEKLDKAFACSLAKKKVDDSIKHGIEYFKQGIDESVPFIRFHLDGLEEKVT